MDSNVSEPAALIDYSEDGVDLTLIRWMLSLTPAERLQILQNHVDRDPAQLRDHPRTRFTRIGAQAPLNGAPDQIDGGAAQR